MIAERIPQLSTLTKDEKWQLMVELEEELWDDESDKPEAILAVLEERRRYYEEHPESAMTLEEARRRMLESKSRA
jgi:hypothetical protein